MRVILIAVLVMAIAVAGCATKQQSAIGSVVYAGGFDNKGTPVYQGNITRKYRVVKEIRIRRRQIHGPNYHDHLNSVGWVSRAGDRLGADAVINYGSKRIPGQVFILDPGYFEVWGTAVKFTQ